MFTTSASLLCRLREPGEQKAWSRFVRLYTPMLYSWARQMGLQEADADDLVQEVFALLVEKLPEFDYDDERRFRGWLWTLTKHRYLERVRRKALPIDAATAVSELTAPPEPSLDEIEFQRYLVSQALPALRDCFQPSTWRAFWAHVVEGKSPKQVAAEQNIDVAAVYVAKCRVLSRLHRELALS